MKINGADHNNKIDGHKSNTKYAKCYEIMLIMVVIICAVYQLLSGRLAAHVFLGDARGRRPGWQSLSVCQSVCLCV